MALALKYRPQTLNDTIGQEQVTAILSPLLLRWQQDEIMLPSGLLFAGNKGSGKTSTARVVAAAVNCYKFSAEAIPCGTCIYCVDVQNGTSPSVIELDGATNGKIEDVRRLKDIARLHHSGKTRVIIMDECHALTKEAWSAMLKQLEEPAPNVLYIFVTTDPQRIPDTILSRTLIFQFLPITVQHIMSRLRYVCDVEGLTADDNVLEKIAGRSQGALRDALMFLEQLSIADAGAISIDRFKQLWPLDESSYASQFFDAVMANDIVSAMSLNRKSLILARDVTVLVDAITSHLCNLLAGSSEFQLHVERFKDHAPILLNYVWDLRVRLRNISTNDPALLDLLFVQMSNYVTGRLDAAPKPMKLSSGSIPVNQDFVEAEELEDIFS